jgi:hypothetical protein
MEGVEGMTLVMIRSSQNEDNTFIDSPDGMCDRANTPDFFCKISATRYSIENSTLLFRLPYSEFLFNISIDPSNK